MCSVKYTVNTLASFVSNRDSDKQMWKFLN